MTRGLAPVFRAISPEGLGECRARHNRHIEATPVPISAALHPVQSPATAFQQAVSFFLIFEFCLARFFLFFKNFTHNILLHKKLAVFPTGSLRLINCTINCSLFNVDLMGAWGKGGMVETGLFLDKQERDLLVEGTFFPRRPGGQWRGGCGGQRR